MRFVVPTDPVGGGVRADPQAGAVAGADDGPRLFALAVGGVDPDRRAEDLFAGWWRLIAALGAVPGRWSGTARARSGASGRPIRADQRVPGVSRGAGAKVIISRPPTRKPRASSSAPMTIWSARFCPADVRLPGDFNAQLPTGWPWSTPAPGGRWAALRPIGSARTAPRCWRCRRWRRRSAGGRLDAAGARSLRAVGLQRLLGASGRDRPADRGRAPIWTGSRRSATARRSPTMSGCGPGIRPSPTPTISGRQGLAPQPDRRTAPPSGAETRWRQLP